MEKLLVHGPVCLQGEVSISGAKNAVLPILAACLLLEEPITLYNIPYLRDVSTMMELLSSLGVECMLREKNGLTLDASRVNKTVACYDLVRRMRASIVVLGPLLARFGVAEVSLPGGCAIGARPVDLHINAMKALGAQVEVNQGYIKAHTKTGHLQGGHISFETVTVTGTENAIMAAVLAVGETTIEMAACEPEVVDLCHFLQAMGAQIEGVGSNRLRILGVDKLKPQQPSYHVIFDRIEAGTFLIAAAITAGDVTVKDVEPDKLQSLLEVLQQTGGELIVGEDQIRLNMHARKAKAVSIVTAPYPGFPTDLQAQLVAMNCVAEGEAKVVETVFESRFMHVQELTRLGADIRIDHNAVITRGGSHLCAAEVMATDLRASASLVLAALAAEGTTTVNRIYHIDRGYERLEEKFNLLGATIERVHGE